MAPRLRELERLVEGVHRPRIPASCPNAPDRDERADSADRVVRLLQHVVRERRPGLPAAAIDVDESEPRSRVLRPDVALLRERNVLPEVPLRAIELVHLAQAAAEHRERRTHAKLEIMVACDREAPVEEADSSLYVARHDMRRPDHVEAERQQLHVAEALGDGYCLTTPFDPVCVVAIDHPDV